MVIEKVCRKPSYISCENWVEQKDDITTNVLWSYISTVNKHVHFPSRLRERQREREYIIQQ